MIRVLEKDLSGFGVKVAHIYIQNFHMRKEKAGVAVNVLIYSFFVYLT